MKGTFLARDFKLGARFEQATQGCSTGNVMIHAAYVLMHAIEDELASDLVPKARKKRIDALRSELNRVILGAPGDRAHLIRFSSPELREMRAQGRLPTAEIFPFKR
ncbi:MAG: hypothetical protein Q8M24_04805 [Pseudolabrys sp.]|nr:hypothetical protein [Pseudolabrys sp.]MDP2294766.1 hypothetical protein [Pseudolabrys sp.]